MGNLRPIFDSELTELHEEKGVVARVPMGPKTLLLFRFRRALKYPREHPVKRNIFPTKTTETKRYRN